MKERTWLPLLLVALLLVSLVSRAADTRLLDTIRNDQAAALTVLLKSGADANVRDESGATALMYAVIYTPSVDALRALVGAGADVNAANANGSTALMWAAGDTAKARFLLDRGARVAAETKDGTTALISAAHHGNAEVMQLLMARGADPKATAKNGVGLLRIANVRRDASEQRVLANAGVTLAAPAQRGSWPISENLFDTRLVRALVSAGAPIDVSVPFGAVSQPTIALAAFAGNPDAVQLLLDRGADPNAKNTRGQTALMMAAGGAPPSAPIARALVNKGADLTARDDRGRTALDWALLQGDTDAAILLRGAGAPTGARLSPAPAPIAVPRMARDAVAIAIRRMQPIGPTFNQRTKCISCHHESVPGIATTLASAHGVSVDRQLAAHPTQATLAMWTPAREDLLLGFGSIGGFEADVGYGLLQFAEEGVAPNAVTDAVTLCLAAAQRSDGSWVLFDTRPPLSDLNPISYTALAVHALSTYTPPGRRSEMNARIARAREYIRRASTNGTHDESFKLLGLLWSGASSADISTARAHLLARQNSDGGWSQQTAMASDAYATGLALYALHASGVSAASAAYQKGAQYLLRTQAEDGTWFVRSRAFGFQAYFETGFPYGADQFISAAATAWAAIALSYAL